VEEVGENPNTMNSKSTIGVSKYLSFILRHNPKAGGINLDEEGWVDLEDIIAGSKKQITVEEIEAAVEHNDKKRFEVLEGRIRASQGHSVGGVKVTMPEYVPDGPVYHGTVEENVKSILKDGLQPRKRHHVHLSKDVKTATTVGKRHGDPIILEIDARKMRADGIPLMESKNGVVLADGVPPSYIKRMES
jgi:putative RNA 2'-phosphotransferase